MIDEIRISNEKDYQPSVAAAINRRTSFSIKDGKLVTQHQYSIDRKNYIGNSIFDMNSKLSSHCLQNKQSVKFSINSAFFIEMCFNKCKKIIKSNKKACT